MNKEEYEILKKLCNKYEKEQKNINASKMYNIDVLDNVIYITDKTSERPDYWLPHARKYLKSYYSDYKDDITIVMDLHICNSFGLNDLGKNFFYINLKNNEIIKIKENDENYQFYKEKVKTIRNL